MNAAPRIAPVTTDHDTGGFFAAAARGALAICFCAACDRPVHLPQPRCAACGSAVVEWRDVAPRGHVYSWTVAEHQVHPAYPVPHTLVLVELDDVAGIRLAGCLPGRVDVAIGTPLVAEFVALDNGTVIPEWHLAAAD